MEVLNLKEPLKVLSTAGLATVFAASSIIPVAAVEAPAEKVTFEEVVLVHEDKPFELFKRDYFDYKGMFGDETVFQELDADDLAITFDKVGYVEINEETGEVKYIWDDQSEDRLNETFFYNVA